MYSLDEVKEKYNWIKFKEYNKNEPLEDPMPINDLDTFIKLAKDEVEYIWYDWNETEATDQLVKVLLTLYTRGVAENLEALWKADKNPPSEEDREYQISLLNVLAKQLQEGEFDESRELRAACHSEFFKQIILFNRKENIFFTKEETDRSPEEVNVIMELVDNIMQNLFKEILDEQDDTESEYYS